MKWVRAVTFNSAPHANGATAVQFEDNWKTSQNNDKSPPCKCLHAHTSDMAASASFLRRSLAQAGIEKILAGKPHRNDLISHAPEKCPPYDSVDSLARRKLQALSKMVGVRAWAATFILIDFDRAGFASDYVWQSLLRGRLNWEASAALPCRSFAPRLGACVVAREANVAIKLIANGAAQPDRAGMDDRS